MKRIICGIICLIIAIPLISCNSNSDTLTITSGNYYAEGDYKEGLTPYVSLSLDDNAFGMGAGSLVSFQCFGSFEIKGSKLIATTQIATFEFEIKDTNTLVLTDNGDNEYFKIPINTQFLFSNDWK